MQPLRIYYAATAIFLLLDYLFGINVRVAFLEPWPVWRFLYYLFCFGCLAVMLWKPALTTLVSAVESLLTLSALILHMGVRVMSLSVGVLEEGADAFIHFEEIVNFVISGSVAWWGWQRGSSEIQRWLRG
ncbi:MAG: hypothetical protein ACR2QR_07620 [Woeseiaceae bacterium]